MEVYLFPNKLFPERSKNPRLGMLNKEIGISPSNKLSETNNANKSGSSAIQLGIMPVRLLFDMLRIYKDVMLRKPRPIFPVNRLLSIDSTIIIISVKFADSLKISPLSLLYDNFSILKE